MKLLIANAMLIGCALLVDLTAGAGPRAAEESAARRIQVAAAPASSTPQNPATGGLPGRGPGGFNRPVGPSIRVVAAGPFEPTWESLVKNYQSPEWFRDAKFGIWAHWSAQCVPEYGDWYARDMYIQGTRQYSFHVAKYGHPSKFGFMELDNLWKAEKWDPDKLMQLYVRAGAKYFVALANHHDNFDAYAGKLTWTQDETGLRVQLPDTAPCEHAVALKIHGAMP